MAKACSTVFPSPLPTPGPFLPHMRVRSGRRLGEEGEWRSVQDVAGHNRGPLSGGTFSK